jgi:hypothetical protein
MQHSTGHPDLRGPTLCRACVVQQRGKRLAALDRASRTDTWFGGLHERPWPSRVPSVRKRRMERWSRGPTENGHATLKKRSRFVDCSRDGASGRGATLRTRGYSGKAGTADLTEPSRHSVVEPSRCCVLSVARHRERGTPTHQQHSSKAPPAIKPLAIRPVGNETAGRTQRVSARTHVVCMSSRTRRCCMRRGVRRSMAPESCVRRAQVQLIAICVRLRRINVCHLPQRMPAAVCAGCRTRAPSSSVEPWSVSR